MDGGSSVLLVGSRSCFISMDGVVVYWLAGA